MARRHLTISDAVVLMAATAAGMALARFLITRYVDGTWLLCTLPLEDRVSVAIASVLTVFAIATTS